MTRRLTLAVAAAIAVLAVAAASALATGAWSAPQQIDQTAAHHVDGLLVMCPSTSLCFGSDLASGGPLIYHLSATGMPAGSLAYPLPVPFGSDDESGLAGLQCPATSLCVGVGSYNALSDDPSVDVVTSTTPAAGPSSWVRQHVVDPPLQLSCPTVTFCAGAGVSGAVVTSQSPGGGAAAWTSTKLTSPLIEVECPSAAFCIAVDMAGNVWTSSDPTGGTQAWARSVAHAPLAGIATAQGGFTENLSCSGPSLCIATDDSGALNNHGFPRADSRNVLVSTDPAGPHGWTSVPATSLGVSAVYCQPGTPLCLAGDVLGDIATSTDGQATDWTSASIHGPGGSPGHSGIGDISCTGQRCVASSLPNTPGVPALATVPAAGAAWVWTPLDAQLHDALSAVSCPSASQCLAADAGRFHLTENPNQGAGSWQTRRPKIGGFDNPDTVDTSCYSATDCLTVTADDGDASSPAGYLYRFNPVGGPHGFHKVGIGGSDDVVVTCAQGTCVTGFPGAWYQTAHPALNTGWRKVRSPQFDVTCLSGNTACVALAAGPFPGMAGPDLLVAPRRGGPWTSEVVDPRGQITGLACTSARACVVVDNGGQMLVSSTPTAGPASWHVSDTDLDGFTGVACRDAHTCVATDDNGAVVVGRP